MEVNIAFRAVRSGTARLLKPFIKHPLDTFELFGLLGGYCICTSKGALYSLLSRWEPYCGTMLLTIGNVNKNAEGRDTPIIRDNVWICSNSVIFSGIDISNNVKMDTRKILNKLVPDNCTVVGNPAHIIKKDGIKCNELL